MITNSKESLINKSAANRHSCISTRKRMPVRFVPSVPVNKKAVKITQDNVVTEPSIEEELERHIIEENQLESVENQLINVAVNDKPEQQIIEEIPEIIIENQPIEVQPKEEPVKASTMEDSVKTTVNEVPVERNVEIEQRTVSKIPDNRVVNTGRHYTYNSILGTHIRHD